jgi:anti-sigma factor RsiW
MNVADLREEVICQDLVELVTDYIEGVLDPEVAARFEEHLEVCGKCRTYVEQFRLVISEAGRITEESLSPATRAGLIKAFHGWRAG